MSDDGILHFNPWMDFNDGPPSENPFGCDPDPEQIATSGKQINSNKNGSQMTAV